MAETVGELHEFSENIGEKNDEKQKKLDDISLKIWR